MPNPSRARAGFTLVELMIVVGILAILAMIAIPSFVTYVKRAKAAESRDALKQLFTHAASYFARELTGSGMTATHQIWCTVGNADNGVVPGSHRQLGDYSAAPWTSLGFTTPSSYYRYEIHNAVETGGRCGTPAATDEVYYFRARGNLDDDEVQSMIELAVGSTSDNELFHGRSFYVLEEEE